MLNQEHVARVSVELLEGLNRISVYAGDAGAALERLILVKEGKELLPSYLGPESSVRSFRKNNEERKESDDKRRGKEKSGTAGCPDDLGGEGQPAEI